MTSNNSQISENSQEVLRKAWKIDGINSLDGWLNGYLRVPNVFFRYMNELNLGGSQASLGMMLLYLISRDFGNKKGHCFPGHAEIAKHLGVTITTVERSLKKLKDMGMIEVENRVNNNLSFSNNYYYWEGFKEKFRQLLIRDGLIKQS